MGPPTILRLKQVTFEPNGSFNAVAIRQAKPAHLSGSYALGFRKLVLETPTDSVTTSRTFQAKLIGKVLRLRRGGITMRLRKIQSTSSAKQSSGG